ncbi:hypothetical protein ACYATL_06665 [Actinotignum timonense]|uniref:hypothetical protein n=1 Tax=Actinotignum TaxID=1653174 RepID=UPI00254BFB21|nr:hypothetical protein [Actinotignum timonense]MDK6906619.1 hypothetical protein [Actinotignum timonense]
MISIVRGAPGLCRILPPTWNTGEVVSQFTTWEDAAAALRDTYAGARADETPALRFVTHGVPVTAWPGQSTRRDSRAVVHLAAPVLTGAELRKYDGAAASAASSTHAASEPGTQVGTEPAAETGAPPTTQSDAQSDAQSDSVLSRNAAAVLEHFGIDPTGPDLIAVLRAADALPIGGIRLLGGRAHIHYAVGLPVPAAQLAACAALVAAQARAMSGADASHAHDVNASSPAGADALSDATREGEADV